MYSTLKERDEYYLKITEKRRANKERLVNECINMLWDNQYEYSQFIKDLLWEALNKRTQKELKEIL